MALLKIRIAPDAVLRRRAREVRVIDAAIRKLAQDMIETMQDARGVGLAANQVGILKRVIVLQMPDEDPRVLVNPEVTLRTGERQVDEGCLSLPGYIGLVTRSVKIKARALDEWGGKIRLTAEDLLAQAIEHEVDHLNGILYVDHLVAHEQLRKVDRPLVRQEDGQLVESPEPPGADRPHMHDIALSVEVDHGDPEAIGGRKPTTEVLASKIEIAGVTRDASVADLAFDVNSAPRTADTRPAPVRRRVRSANRALNGGVIVEGARTAPLDE